MLHRHEFSASCTRLETGASSAKRILKVAVILSVLPLLSPVRAIAEQFQVYKVVDGNTLMVRNEKDEKITVRLVGIDAPEPSTSSGESGQPFGRQSAKHLASLVLGRVVDVQFYGLDGFGRMLGEVFAGDRNINLEMVRAGFAEVFRGKPAEGLSLAVYREAEKEAREANRGKWALGDNYVGPKEWGE
ncbi:MAG: thermonuclease family protein [Hyphomicrobiales bacterium]